MKTLIRLLPLCAIFCLSTQCEDNDGPIDPVDTVPPAPVVTIDFAMPHQNMTLKYGDTIPFLVQSSYADKTLSEATYSLDGKEIGKGDSLMALHFPLVDIGGGRHQLSAEGVYADGSKGTQLIFFNVVSDVTPMNYDYRVVQKYPHDTEAYTQGLEFYDNVLYESTGLENGRSSLRRVNMNTGKVDKMISLESQYFAEGMTFWGEQIYQLTYTSQLCFVYDRNDLNKLTEHPYAGQGWGLSHDSTHLIMSDGSAEIRFLNPGSFAEDRRITVYDNKGPVNMLNELEYINGEIWANIYQTDKIVRIDPATGKVLAYLHMENMLTPQERQKTDVLNGIAFNPETGKYYVTGKLWPWLFEVAFMPRAGLSPR